MKRLSFYLILTFAIVTNLCAQTTIKVNAPSWSNVYAWIWNTNKQYNERFIPLTKVDETTWILSIDINSDDYNDAGILFVNNNSWKKDYSKTSDLPLHNACYRIADKYTKWAIIQTGARMTANCKVLYFNCDEIECK